MVSRGLSARLDPQGEFLQLIQNPFKSAFQVKAVWASLATALSITLFLTVVFSLLRPRHTVVYAPKAKHADSKHSPPAVGSGLLAWVKPVLSTTEDELADRIGVDAAVFLRFTKMCRNIFLAMSLLGCLVMIPVNISQSSKSLTKSMSVFTTMTPLFVTGNAVWVQVVFAWVFDIIVCFFLWRNYRAVRRLRCRYFQSPDYQLSLHARTLIVTDVPPGAVRSDEGLLRLTDAYNPTAALPRASIGRNVKTLPALIREHEDTVRQLESVLAKYLKRADQPGRARRPRPTLRPPRSLRQRGSRVDAIDFLTMRIKVLEEEIKHVRASIDRRNAMPYGFVSWQRIEDAHAVAYAARRAHPHGTTIRLAPRPNDLIWENLALSRPARRWKRLVNMFWVTLLTVVWIVPNAMIAIFLSNLSNLGLVWRAFQTSLDAHPGVWAAVQGVASPAVTSLVYLVLPIIFRRLAVRAGDVSKTSRERHVLHRLYAFFIFNNLVVFSLFSAAWAFVAMVIAARNRNEGVLQAIRDGHLFAKMVSALCEVSPFWVMYLLQRNLGAAIDLAQLVNMAWIWAGKTFFAPTPRQAIEWTAPPPFDYASYYNYFLFYATVALCFGTLQPVVLVVTALYFALDALMKEYLLLYIFVTKTESGGRFWRVLFNRMLFATLLSNAVAALVAGAQGSRPMVYCIAPLPALLLAFKFYCMTSFDRDLEYYGSLSAADKTLPVDRTMPFDRASLVDKSLPFDRASPVDRTSFDKNLPFDKTLPSSRFGHPALYKPLITPMVHAKAADALRQIYSGRLSDPASGMALDEYSDTGVIVLDAMSAAHRGKPLASTSTSPTPSAAAASASASTQAQTAPFEFVPESQLDLSYFKDRPEFRTEFGDGVLYGPPADLVLSERDRSARTATPRSFVSGEWLPSSRAASPDLAQSDYSWRRQQQQQQQRLSSAFRPPRHENEQWQQRQLYQHDNESETRLLGTAQAPAPALVSLDRWRMRPGYGRVEQEDD